MQVQYSQMPKDVHAVLPIFKSVYLYVKDCVRFTFLDQAFVLLMIALLNHRTFVCVLNCSFEESVRASSYDDNNITRIVYTIFFNGLFVLGLNKNLRF